MTTTDMPDARPTPPPPADRVLRRSRDGRVAAGVAGGLGEYFNVDPVLFRVLFATSAFFGGAGILAYLVAWAAIPDRGTERAPIDGLIGELRRRRIPPWVVAIAIGVIVWAAAFSWWLPGPAFPVVAVVVLLVVVFGRREMQGRAAPVDLTKRPSAPDSNVGGRADGTSDERTDGPPPPAGPAQPDWVTEGRRWWEESRESARRRRRRALPVKIGVLGGLVATLVVLGVVDAVAGIPLVAYLWTLLAFVGAGLLLGLVLRRTPWSIAGLLPVTVAGLVAFGGSHASLHDGIGDRTWTPTTTPASEYRLAFGQGVLDLRSLPQQTTAKTVRLTSAAGQVRILLPPTANVRVDANVHIGQLDVRGAGVQDSGDGGISLNRSVLPPADATGEPVTIDVHLSDGHLEIVRG